MKKNPIIRDENGKGACIGVMVWCQSCNTVVWALDSDVGDLRGILNMLKIPCRLCRAIGNYDQYSANTHHMEMHGTFDGWSTMKALANYERLEWNPSPDNTWRSNEEVEGSLIPPDIDPDYEAARDAARDEAAIVQHVIDLAHDLHTIDLAHDLGVIDLTDPFSGETV